MAKASVPPFVADYAPYTKGFGTTFVDTARDASRFWDFFYRANAANFFKDRHWLLREFPELAESAAEECSILEIGCGVGNTVYPLLDEVPRSTVYCLDFSPTAIALLRDHSAFDRSRVVAMVHDLTLPPIPSSVPDAAMHFVTMIFVLSAIPESHHLPALQSAAQKLRPGGWLFFRDYAEDDMTQRRFRPSAQVAANTFRRHDGTRTFFFSKEHWEGLCRQCGLTPVATDDIRKTVVNAKEGKEMHRVFLQSRAQRVS